MNKKIVLILLVIVVVILCTIVVLLNRVDDEESLPQPVTDGGTAFPSGGGTGTGTGTTNTNDSFSFTTQGTEAIVVTDIRKSEGTTEAYGEYTFGSMVTGSADYQLVYTEGTHDFMVLLLGLPLSYARKNAERELLQKLGIDDETACRLPIYVSTIDKVSEQYAGHNLGLSFCPGSVEIP